MGTVLPVSPRNRNLKRGGARFPRRLEYVFPSKLTIAWIKRDVDRDRCKDCDGCQYYNPKGKNAYTSDFCTDVYDTIAHSDDKPSSQPVDRER